MSRATAKVSPKRLREDDQESVRKGRRSPVERCLRKPYWRDVSYLRADTFHQVPPSFQVWNIAGAWEVIRICHLLHTCFFSYVISFYYYYYYYYYYSYYTKILTPGRLSPVSSTTTPRMVLVAVSCACNRDEVPIKKHRISRKGLSPVFTILPFIIVGFNFHNYFIFILILFTQSRCCQALLR